MLAASWLPAAPSGLRQQLRLLRELERLGSGSSDEALLVAAVAPIGASPWRRQRVAGQLESTGS